MPALLKSAQRTTGAALTIGESAGIPKGDLCKSYTRSLARSNSMLRRLPTEAAQRLRIEQKALRIARAPGTPLPLTVVPADLSGCPPGDTVAAEQTLERAPVLAGRLGRARDIAVLPGEHAGQVLTLEFLYRVRNR